MTTRPDELTHIPSAPVLLNAGLGARLAEHAAVGAGFGLLIGVPLALLPFGLAGETVLLAGGVTAVMAFAVRVTGLLDTIRLLIVIARLRRQVAELLEDNINLTEEMATMELVHKSTTRDLHMSRAAEQQLRSAVQPTYRSKESLTATVRDDAKEIMRIALEMGEWQGRSKTLPKLPGWTKERWKAAYDLLKDAGIIASVGTTVKIIVPAANVHTLIDAHSHVAITEEEDD